MWMQRWLMKISRGVFNNNLIFLIIRTRSWSRYLCFSPPSSYSSCSRSFAALSRYIKRKKFVTSWKGNRISVDNGAPNAIHFSINMIRIVDPDGWSTSVTQLALLAAYTRFTFRLRSTKKCKFVNDATPTDSSSENVLRSIGKINVLAGQLSIQNA